MTEMNWDDVRTFLDGGKLEPDSLRGIFQAARLNEEEEMLPFKEVLRHKLAVADALAAKP